MNTQLVGSQGDTIVILVPKQRMTKREAVELAAWLVVLADNGNEFQTIRTAIENGE